MDMKTLLGTTALGLAVGTAPGFADVTAEDVWNEFKAQMSIYDDSFRATEEKSGDTLTVSGLEITFDVPRDDPSDPNMTVEGKLGAIEFRELGDGTVSVVFPDQYLMEFDALTEQEKLFETDVTLSHTGLSILASGDPDNIAYVMNAPSMAYQITGKAGDEAYLNGMAEMRGLTGEYTVTTSELKEVVSDLRADAITMQFDVVPPDENRQGQMQMSFEMEGITSSGRNQYPADANFEEFSEVLQAGSAFGANFTHGPMQYAFKLEEPGQNIDASGTGSSGSFLFAMDSEALRYGTKIAGMEMDVKGSAIPFPQIGLTMERYDTELSIPLAQSDAPSDFGLAVKLLGLAIDNEIWGIFDPAQVLPRDPVSISLDLSGQANWLVDIFDEKSIAASIDKPGELHALDVNELALNIAGAELTGKAGFTFDNSDLVSFGGAPKPLGDAEFRLVGANGLLEKLATLGFVPAEQLFGIRAMMGIFASPVAGQADTLTSKIVVDEAGAVYANGQRLK